MCCFCGDVLHVVIYTNRKPWKCICGFHPGARHAMCGLCELWFKFSGLPASAEPMSEESGRALFCHEVWFAPKDPPR